MQDFESPYFDEIMIRFPILFQGILNELDNKSLAKCRKVNKEWQIFIDNEKFVSIRKLQKYHRNMEEFSEHWKKVTRNASKEIIGELSVAVHKFFEVELACNSFTGDKRKRKEEQWSPLHITAEQGHLELSKYVIEKTGDTNSINKKAYSAFQMAAEKGQLEVCKLIIESLEDKNPRGYQGWSALHFAAINGHLEVCKHINESIEDGVDVENGGCTPLHCAVEHLDVYKMFVGTLENKNHTANGNTWTPLHQAAALGRFDVCRFIIESGADKKPIGRGPYYSRWNGYTPLNVAAAEGHPRTCKLFIDEWADLIEVVKGMLYTKNRKVSICVVLLLLMIYFLVLYLIGKFFDLSVVYAK